MAEGRRWTTWVAIGCGGLVVLGVVAGVSVFLLVRSMTAAPEQVVRDFYAAAAAGDYARAHSHLSAPLRQTQPLDAFTADVQRAPALFDIVETSFTERSIDMAGARLAGTATLRAGTIVPVSFTLVREHDTWTLLAYRVGAAP